MRLCGGMSSRVDRRVWCGSVRRKENRNWEIYVPHTGIERYLCGMLGAESSSKFFTWSLSASHSFWFFISHWSLRGKRNWKTLLLPPPPSSLSSYSQHTPRTTFHASGAEVLALILYPTFLPNITKHSCCCSERARNQEPIM